MTEDAVVPCPSCRQPNPEGKRFCGDCGAPLQISCPSCGVSNPANKRFCGDCGSPLSGSASPSAPDTRAPVGAVEGTEEERRLVTVLFADLEGFTSLAERLDPEDVRDIQTDYFRLMRGEIKRFGGTLDKYAGDAVLAIFGVPMAHEDDAERAVRCALATQAGMEALAEETYRRWGKRLALRVGVNTGEVVTGVWNVEGRQDYAVSGDVVNTAARLQTAAEPGSVLVGAETKHLTEQCIRFGDSRDLTVRGKAERVLAYPALSLQDRVVERWETLGRRAPLVGRDRELRQLLDLWERAREGEGQLVSVVGDAGVGKSRFVAEATERICARGDVRVLEGRCASYGQEISLWLIADLIRDHCKVTPHDTPVEIRGRLRADVAELLHDQDHDTRAAASDVLGEVLGLPPGDSMVAAASPQIRRQVLLRSLRLLLAATQETPTLLILQDLHWIDRASTEVLTELLPDVPGLHLMVLTTQRPGWSAEWSEWSWPERIRLRPLGERDAAVLAGAVLGDVALSPGLQQYIGERTGGNPFFVEELLRTLRDTGDLIAVGEQVELAPGAAERLPPTLTEILLARLDRLEAQLRNLAQVASVIGRQFAVQLLAEVVGRETNALEMPLVKLQQAEIAFPRHGASLEYAFKHALLRDVAYTTLLHKRRQTLHVATARAMASLYDPDDGAEMIAYHYSKTEEHMEAAEWLERAGDQAAKKYDNTEALRHYQQAHGRFKEAGADATSLARLDAKRGKILHTMGKHDQALESLRSAADVYRRAGDRENMADSVAHIGWVHAIRATPRDGIREIQEVLRIYGEDGPSRSLAAMYFSLQMLHQLNGQFDEALTSADRAESLAEAVDDIALQAQAKSHKGAVLQRLGRYEESLQVLREALPLAERTQNPDILRPTLTFVGVVYLLGGRLEESRSHLRRARELAQKTGDTSWAAMTTAALGLIDFHLGDWVSARAQLQEAVNAETAALHSTYPPRWLAQISVAEGKWEDASRYLERASSSAAAGRILLDTRPVESLFAELDLLRARPKDALSRLEPLIDGKDSMQISAALLPYLAWTYLELGDTASADRVAQAAVGRASDPRQPLVLVEAQRVAAMALARQQRWDEAESGFEQAAALAREIHDPYAEARARYEYGRAALEQGQTERAREQLEAAQAIFHRLGAEPYLEMAGRAIAGLRPA